MSTLKSLTANTKFIRFAGNVALNSISVGVYEKEDGALRLIVERNNKALKLEDGSTATADMSADDYENLDSDPYNNLVRLQAAANACGFSLN